MELHHSLGGMAARWSVMVRVPTVLSGGIIIQAVLIRDDASRRWAQLISQALHGDEEGWMVFARKGVAEVLNKHPSDPGEHTP